MIDRAPAPAMDMTATPGEPLQLTRRLGVCPEGVPPEAGHSPLHLPLTAEERTRLRGLRRSACGRDLLLQLPRGEALEPGEWLAASEDGLLVQVVAAVEPLLVVRAADPLDLLRASYHLGNRHVALEVRADALCLLEDPVLADLLLRRGLSVERSAETFLPEGGAYAGGHGYGEAHEHTH
jgi:urease accessory protein